MREAVGRVVVKESQGEARGIALPPPPGRRDNSVGAMGVKVRAAVEVPRKPMRVRKAVYERAGAKGMQSERR
jgi:hypothetical protein